MSFSAAMPGFPGPAVGRPPAAGRRAGRRLPGRLRAVDRDLPRQRGSRPRSAARARGTRCPRQRILHRLLLRPRRAGGSLGRPRRGGTALPPGRLRLAGDVRPRLRRGTLVRDAGPRAHRAAAGRDDPGRRRILVVPALGPDRHPGARRVGTGRRDLLPGHLERPAAPASSRDRQPGAHRLRVGRDGTGEPGAHPRARYRGRQRRPRCRTPRWRPPASSRSGPWTSTPWRPSTATA